MCNLKKETPDSEQTNLQNKENLKPIEKGNTLKPKPGVNLPIAQRRIQLIRKGG